MAENIKEINYEQSYVAFLDVLGFKELVYSKKDEDKKKLERYFHNIDIAINYLKKIREKEHLDIGYIVISDSIIITVKQHSLVNKNIEILQHLCIAIGFLQSMLASNDIWMRGGISSGETFFDKEKNQIIGKAYIDAYLLEDKMASNPQVILDNKIINELGFNNSNDLINKINEKNKGFLKFNNCGKTILYDWSDENYINKDFPLFIDYLSLQFNPNKNTFFNNRENRRIMIEKIIKNIEKNIYTKTPLYQKFKWVDNYVLSIIKNNKRPENQIYIDRLKGL